MDKPIKAGIAGAAGYTGGELIRLLLHHPDVHIAFAHSNSNAGNPVHQIHRDLVGETDLIFASDLDLEAVDVLFLCVGHGEARKLLSTLKVPEQVKIIDLSQDFRLSEQAAWGQRNFVYGLPELNKPAIAEASSIANPGCFATAIQLALLPLAKAGLLQAVHVTGITGATGAGQSLQAPLHFPWRANNISAYKSLQHQHLHEIKQSLTQLQPGTHTLHFVPWRGDFTRGIFVSCVLPFAAGLGAAEQLYQQYYENQAFTHVVDSPLDLKQVVNTNKCLIQLEHADGQLVVHAAIDNLLKGASGQAVQNMNLMFGLDEKAGLSLKAINF
ncbi:MAG TPA: N-acetyl-gamma-glutamyl-phosphate reductase [Saprospiraceae bacterium]|nr:N-acetyl-gamma-glutamyl-phosphate reductase [Saprospiraceae bacterium]